MYVPGDDTRKLRKASQLRVDFIALDCEDGVAVSRKKLARDTIRAFYDSNLNEMPTDHTQHQQRQSEWSVRVNSIASGLCDEDLRVIVSGKRVPESLLLPKCESADDLKCVRGYKKSAPPPSCAKSTFCFESPTTTSSRSCCGATAMCPPSNTA